MSPQFKKEYMEAIYLRYRDARRSEKTIILNELCQNCGWHRKHAIRKLRSFKRFAKPKRKKRGKPSVYNKPFVIEPLKRIWLAANLPCSKILKAALPIWIPFYAKEYGSLSVAASNALRRISASTIDRLLKPTRQEFTRRGRSTTKPGTLLRKQIPIKTNQWDESKPGFLEADTVAHCGDSLSGMFVYTANFVDIATGWTEQRAVWGKGEEGVFLQVKDVESTIPFPILGFDCDNGGEFINHHLVKHFLGRQSPVQFTRSRPYHSDDNAHVEQKNWTHVRQWLGYVRLDNPAVVPLMNDLYRSEWRLFLNFFCPSVKLIEKKRVASKTIKRYDPPKTPFQRVLESKHVSADRKALLQEQYDLLNPFQLRKAIERKLQKIYDVNRSKRTH